MESVEMSLDDSNAFSPFRTRANTWPLPREENIEEDIEDLELIEETPSSSSSNHHLGNANAASGGVISPSNSLRTVPQPGFDGRAGSDASGPQAIHPHHQRPPSNSIPGAVSASTSHLLRSLEEPVIPTTTQDSSLIGGSLDSSSGIGSASSISSNCGNSVGTNGSGSGGKKNSSRRNAWGNMSYADLITQAIQGAPDQRLTLSQIYDWMVQNVNYFKDKGDSNSSAGWKNSIRHNLSLHNRFMRVQNEGTGKSSWWMINPEAKPGKSARRRATSMETHKFEKKRGRVKKKLDALKALNGSANALHSVLPSFTPPSPSSSISEGFDLFPDSPATHPALQLSPDFRPRASSNASSCGGRLSPIPGTECLDMHDAQVPPLSPIGSWSAELGRLFVGGPVSGSDLASLTGNGACPEQFTDQFTTMKLGSGYTDVYQQVRNSPASNSGTDSPIAYALNNGYSSTGSSTTLYNSNGTVATSGTGVTSTLNRNGSDPYFQNPGAIENSITLTSLNATLSRAGSNGDVKSPSIRSSESAVPSATFSLVSLSPSLSPSASLDAINGIHFTQSPKHQLITVQQQNRAFGDGTPPPPSAVPVSQRCGFDGSISKSLSCSSFNNNNTIGSSNPITTASSLGHILSLNNPLPNDLDLNMDTLQGGLECDVDQVIRHELSVDGNLDFNFINSSANSVGTSKTVMTSANSTHPWVH